jgi:hypothetical protein
MCASVWLLFGVCWVRLSRQRWCAGKLHPFRAQIAARRIPTDPPSARSDQGWSTAAGNHSYTSRRAASNLLRAHSSSRHCALDFEKRVRASTARCGGEDGCENDAISCKCVARGSQTCAPRTPKHTSRTALSQVRQCVRGLSGA